MEKYFAEYFGPSEIDRILNADVKFVEYNGLRSLRMENGFFEKKSIGESIALRDRTREALYYNRVVGLGEKDLPKMDELIAFHHEIGKPSAFSITPDRGVGSAVLKKLQMLGYCLVETNAIFGISCSRAHKVESDIVIRRAQPEDIDVVVALWDQDYDDKLSEQVIQLRGPAQWVPEFPIYLALLDGQVAAMASMYITDGVAWLGNAETFRHFRRRGCQRALLNYRIREAALMGCDLAISDTDFGTISHRNVIRSGMSLIYIEMILCGPKP